MYLRRPVIRLLLLLIFLSPELRPGAAWADQEEPVPAAQRVDLGKRLAQPADWAYRQQPLDQVLTDVASQLDVELHIDRAGLEDFGIGLDTPVSLEVRDISRRSALNLLLQPLDLTWAIRKGMLHVTTREEMEVDLVTRVYPVGDLAQVTGMAPGTYDYNSWIDAITAVIEPESWDVIGGPGAISGIHGALVVLQSAPIHDRLEQFLAAVRLLGERGSNASQTGPAPVVLGGAAAESVREALDKRIVLDFDDAPLDSVFEKVAAKAGVPVLAQCAALEDFGIGKDTPVNFRTRGLSLADALQVMLDPLDLTYLIRDEVLLVTTPEEAEQRLQIGLYPVGDLATPFDTRAAGGTPSPLQAAMAQAATSGFEALGGAAAVAPPGKRGERASLVNTITATIAPESWDTVGGPGVIVVLQRPTVLVVAQTDAIHDRLASLLEELRAARRGELQRWSDTRAVP